MSSMPLLYVPLPTHGYYSCKMRPILIECNFDEGEKRAGGCCPMWHCWLTLTPHLFLPGICVWGGSLGFLESLFPGPKGRVLVRHVTSTLLAFFLPCAQGHKHWAKVSPGSSEVHVSPDTNIVSSISLFQLLGQRLSFRVIPEGSVPNLNLRDFNQDYLTLYFQMIWGKLVGGLKWK